MASYLAILRKEKKSDYGVSFPDLPGCVSAGKTLEEARLNAAEALSLHLEGLIEDGLPVPRPSALDDVVADPENTDGVPFLVEAPDPVVRAVRVNVTLAQSVLEEIDAHVKKHGLTRSAFLAEAALRRLAAAGRHRRTRSSRGRRRVT